MERNTHRLSDFNQPEYYRMADMAKGASSPMAVATLANRFGVVTVGYNNQYNTILSALKAERAKTTQALQDKLSQDPTYTKSRNTGVKLAWEYEKADIEMGGSGSNNWSKEEQDQILNSKTHTVSGAEGHHQKSVDAHPEHQVDPDNIRFYRSRQEHLNAHDGDFRNPTDDPFIDKNKMLERTNNRRVLKNEIKGAGISAAIGFGIAFTISAITELARVGISSADMGDLIGHSMRAGIEGGITATVTYGAGRLLSTVLQNHGVDLLTKTGALINFAAVGVVSIALVSTYQFIKMKVNGVETSVAFKEVGRQALFSISVLAVSVIAQGIWGGCAGLIVSTSVGLIVLTVGVISSAHQRKLDAQIKEFAIEQYKPLLALD